MARWKALPEGLDPIVVQFVVELRRMKDDSGLSLDQLAKRTGYSDSSWERYLGGRAMAPEEAVRALIGLVGADETGNLVLRQAAQEAWAATGQADVGAVSDTAVLAEDSGSPSADGTDAGGEPDFDQAAGPSAEPVPVPVPRQGFRRPRPQAVVNTVTSALTGAAVTVLLLQPWHHDRVAPAAAPAVHVTTAPKPVKYSCSFTQTGGKWYSGNSTTDQSLVADGMANGDVAEVQCLLQHAGISPGGIDGQFGPKTLHAVIQLQMARHLDVDGQVGPQTWAALRG